MHTTRLDPAETTWVELGDALQTTAGMFDPGEAEEHPVVTWRPEG